MSDPLGWFGQQISGFTGATAAQEMRRANRTNEGLQREQWQREDTAMQRKMADLKAAGLNPLSVTGTTGAPSSAPGALIKPVTPADPIGKTAGLVQLIAGLVSGVVDINKTLATTALTQAQEKNVVSRTVGQDLGNQLATALNPMKKTAMEMQLAFDKENNPLKLSQIKSAIAGIDAATAVKKIDVEAKKAGIDFTRQSTILTQIKQQLARQDLSIGEQDLAARLIAVKAAGIQLDILKGLSSTAPGLADGIRKWLGLGSDALDLASKVGNIISPSSFRGGRR